MKYNRIPALCLLLTLLLSVPALAVAGGADDPLISRSYVEGTFRAEVGEALDAAADRALSASASDAQRSDGLTVVTMNAGDTVTLSDGQQLVLLSGGVRLTLGSGSLVNATLGRASTGGDARTGHRYVAWGGATVVAEAGAKGATAAVSPRADMRLSDKPAPKPVDPETEGELPFVDVLADDWFYADVAGAWRRGLVNGMDATHYAPRDNMTLAQAVKLAACMHQLWHDGEVTLENAGGNDPWYYTYVGYALEYDILEEMTLTGWDEPIDRAGFVRLFYRALPAEEYTVINTIYDGAIPDVPTDAAIAREVYGFYAAGILTGYTDDGVHRAGAFDPAGQISRAEVATIMNRMFDPAARVRFDMT